MDKNVVLLRYKMGPCKTESQQDKEKQYAGENPAWISKKEVAPYIVRDQKEMAEGASQEQKRADI